MKSLATLLNLTTTLSQNLTAANQSLMLQMLSDRHRYSIQKYFDNERTFTTTTVGAMPLTLSATPTVGATTATLATTWDFASCSQIINFTDGESRPANFVGGSTAINWLSPLDGQEFQLTNAPSAGATTATLSTAWSATTQSILTYFSDGEQRTVTYTQNSQSISWAGGLSDTVLSFVNTYPQSTSITTNGVQRYRIPAVISKITDSTVNVGQLRYVPAPIMTRQEWDLINFLPYTSDIPNYFFIYNGALELWPIPSTTGDLITFNYKARVADFSTAFLFSDVNGAASVPGQTAFGLSEGTISTATVGSTAITGTSTAWNATGGFPLNTDVSFFNLYLVINPPFGDGIWYPIYQLNSDTSLTLALPIVNAPNITGATYSIAQMPLLQEHFHDMLPYDTLRTYFSSIVENENKFKMFQGLYQERLALLENYAGSKSVNVDLQATPLMTNPNLFFQGGNG